MINFCTLFDSNYLDRGLALYYSLCNVSKDFHLFIMAFDKEAYDVLQAKQCDNLTVELLDDFETEELLAVKPTRTRAEYCWTCGPSIIYHFLTENNLESITYIDADMMFFHDPQILFDEIGTADIAVSPHFIEHESAGNYCVQFNYFKNSDEGLKALTWWRDRCIEWCYYKYEGYKFGDQGYVTKFPELFNNVHVMEHRGTGVASWNMNCYDIDFNNKQLTFNSKVYPIVFFHYHGVYLTIENNVMIMDTNEFDVQKGAQTEIYSTYLQTLCDIRNKELNQNIKSFSIHPRPFIKRFDFWLRAQFRDNKIARWVVYNIFKKKNIK